MLSRVDITQRTMLRRIVGWVSYADDSWEERGRRMAERLRRCLVLHPVKDWSERINERKVKMIESQHDWPYWTWHSYAWHPLIKRLPGRPAVRWHDGVHPLA